MATVMLPKSEYSALKRQANAYRKLAGTVFKFLLRDPITEIIEDFRKTRLYSKEFLGDLEDGLRRSSYHKA